jgi:hypothetical protein
MGGSGLFGRPACCWPGARPPGGAYVYEGGRPRLFCWFMVGRDDELELEACGDRLVGRWVGVAAPWGVGDGLFDDLRFEPTRFLNPAFMDDIEGGEGGRGRPQAGCVLLNVRLESWALRG